MMFLFYSYLDWILIFVKSFTILSSKLSFFYKIVKHLTLPAIGGIIHLVKLKIGLLEQGLLWEP